MLLQVNPIVTNLFNVKLSFYVVKLVTVLTLLTQESSRKTRVCLKDGKGTFLSSYR